MKRLGPPLVLLMLSGASPGQTNCSGEPCRNAETHVLFASDPVDEQHLGISVALAGDVAVAGAYADSERAYWAGAAYVFAFDPETNGWSEEAKLLASDAAWGDAFGYAVAIEADTLAIGAPADDDGCSAPWCDTGAVYVFHRSVDGIGWSEQAKLHASDPREAGHFGIALALDEQVLIAGSPGAPNIHPGAAYVFRSEAPQGWGQEARLEASDGFPGDFFGTAVAICGDVVAVGAPGGSRNGATDPGAVYVYRHDGELRTWVEEARIPSPNARKDDRFGAALALERSVLVIGAPEDASRRGGDGCAFVYRYDDRNGSWFLEAELADPDPDGGEYFGNSVAIHGNAAVVGKYWDCNDLFQAEGAAYKYRFDGAAWGGPVKLIESRAGGIEFFGWAVSLDRNRVLAGAPYRYRNEQGKYYSAPGAAFIYAPVVSKDVTASLGSIVSGDLPDLGVSDDASLHVRSEPGPALTEVVVGFTATGLAADHKLRVNVEHRAGGPAILHVLLMNWLTGQWVTIAQAPSSTDDRILISDCVSSLHAYVRESDGRLDVSLRHVSLAPDPTRPFDAFFDEVTIDAMRCCPP